MEAVASAQGENDMMNTGLNQGSARIYQFPTGGRAALGGRGYGEAKAEFAAPPTDLADCSGSWYHAAAIEDDKSGRDH
jgi:Protein of unknown function (DUF2735)